MASWILERQIGWARSAGLEVDADGRVADAQDHLLIPLSSSTRVELETSPTRPFGEPGKPGALHGLDSTHALACHLFEPARPDPAACARALGAEGGKPGDLRFCVPLDDGPDLEAEVWIDGPRPTALLARLREPYHAPDRRPPPEPRADDPVWRALPGCRQLALDVRANPRRFQRLEVGRVIRAARALTERHGPRGFRLVLPWCAGPGAEARALARETDRLRMRIGGDVELDAPSWTALFERLCAEGALSGGYARQVAARYFAP